jgi:hypothetical protein
MSSALGERDRRPRENDPADRVDVERELAEVGGMCLRELLELQVDLPGQLRDIDLRGREPSNVHVRQFGQSCPSL